MKKNCLLVVTGVLCTLMASVALAQPSTPPLGTDFTALPGFPGPAEGYETVGVDALESGELVVYDGSSVWLEDGVEADTYTEYTGFDGEAGGAAGFVAASPDSAALIGANSTGELWLFEPTKQEGATSLGTVEGVLFGEYLDDTKVLVSVYVEDELDKQAVSELGVVDTANTPNLYTTVATMPSGGVPGGIVVAGDRVYTTDATTGQIRSFDVQNVLDSADLATVFEWEDGALLGAFNDFGPTAVSSQCTLLVSGNDLSTGRGAIQFVSREGEFGGDVNIAEESETAAHLAVYNPDTAKIIAVVTDDSGEGVTVNAYVSNSSYEAASLFGGGLLAILAGAGGLILLLILIFGLL